MGGKDGQGQPVDFVACAKTFNKHIFRHNDTDIFIHSWSKEYEQDILNVYKPKAHIIQPQIKFKTISKGTRGNNEFRLQSRWYSNQEVIRLKAQYEKANKMRYDCVMLCRFDVLMFSDFILDQYDQRFFWASNWNPYPDGDKRPEKPPKYNRSPIYAGGGGLFDLWFFSNSSMMDYFSKAYMLRKNYRTSNTHCLAWRHVKAKFPKSIRYTKYLVHDYDLYRWHIPALKKKKK